MATPSTADEIRARYNVRGQLTPDREVALEELAERRVRSLLRRVVSDDAVHDKPNKLLQEKENYRIYEVPSDDKDTVTLKGVLLLQSSSCEEVMELLSATGAAHVRMLYSDLFGSLFTDCAVLHETSGGAAASSRSSKSRHNGGRSDSTASSITPLQTSAAYHWLMLRDLSSHLPQRDFFLRYNQTHAPDDPVASHRVGWGASVWESVELPTCEPLLSSALCRRHAFSKCGFIVEASEQSDATRVTFFLQSAADDRPWLLKAAASVRFIPSAIVNLRIRHNRFVDKRAWSSTDDCALCAQSFKLFKRQHHCRICGVSVCSKCSDVRQNAIRVCLSCLNGEDTSALWGRVHMGRKKLGASSSSVGSSSSLSYSHSWDTTVKESWTSSASSFSQSMDPTMSTSVSSARVSSLQGSESFSSCARSSAIDEFLDGDAFSTLKLKPTASMASMSSATSASGDEDDVTENTPCAYPLTYAKGNAWPDAPRPSNEDVRLARLQSLNLTQQFAKDNLQELLDLAKTSSNCPVAAVTVVTVSQSLLIAAMGLAGDHVPRDIAFEAHVIMSAEPLVVLDTQKDERFAMNPLVSTLHIRSYIGLPLVTKEGVVVGALSLGDVKTRDKVTGAELRSLQRIASRLVAKMDANNLETSHEVSGVLLL
ncbi:hypothetical protein PINS_up000405 [Pythium insidiosum]|nr:hypothetical protein PINS_up000405 [Pythium insidiosum]